MSIHPEPHIHIERLRQAGYPSIISGVLRAGHTGGMGGPCPCGGHGTRDLVALDGCADFARLGETFLDVRIIQTQRDEAMRALRDFVDWDSIDPKHQEARRVLRSAGHPGKESS
jgi:hypothetical protein